MSFETDLSYGDLTKLEQQLLRSDTSSSMYNTLSRKVVKELLTGNYPAAASRRILHLALEPPTAVTLAAMMDAAGGVPAGLLEGEWSTRASLVDVDTALQPYYGNLNALMKAVSVSEPLREHWLFLFQEGHPVVRVQVTCAVLVTQAMAFLYNG